MAEIITAIFSRPRRQYNPPRTNSVDLDDAPNVEDMKRKIAEVNSAREELTEEIARNRSTLVGDALLRARDRMGS